MVNVVVAMVVPVVDRVGRQGDADNEKGADPGEEDRHPDGRVPAAPL